MEILVNIFFEFFHTQLFQVTFGLTLSNFNDLFLQLFYLVLRRFSQAAWFWFIFFVFFLVLFGHCILDFFGLLVVWYELFHRELCSSCGHFFSRMFASRVC